MGSAPNDNYHHLRKDFTASASLDGPGQTYAYKIESFNLHTSFSMKMVDERI